MIPRGHREFHGDVARFVSRELPVARDDNEAQPWAVTLTAAAVAFAALDLVATAGGLTLASSGILAGQSRAVVAGFLVMSYLTWIAGMRVNLRANAALLSATGTSTNLVSKFAFDRASALTDNTRVRRVAASAGYVGQQLVIELPYYVSAFGAAAASDRIDSMDALIFLGGTNLAAAWYECMLGRLTHGFVNRRNRQLVEPAMVQW